VTAETARPVRRTSAGVPLTYAAVGATKAADLMAYPPSGYRPIERRVRLGSGEERFAAASAKLLSWGVQRGAGIEVRDIQLPAPSDTDYAGLLYDESGAAVGTRVAHPEQTYGPDGTPQVAAGATADLVLRAFGRSFIAPVRVVYEVAEPGRVGFAYGTLPGHPASGEESFVVEHYQDDSVWFVVRAFSRPSTWYYRLAGPVVGWMQARITRRYLRALSPASGA
jgi:uncharacterized protein (UPF0548 family)